MQVPEAASKKDLGARPKTGTTKALVPAIRMCAQLEPLAGRPGGVRTRDSSPPRVSQSETLERSGAGASPGVRGAEAPARRVVFRLTPDFLQPSASLSPDYVNIYKTFRRPRRCSGARNAPRVVVGQAAPAAGSRAAGGLATPGGRPGAGTGTGAGTALLPPEDSLVVPRAQNARHMEDGQDLGLGGPEASPERPGRRCALLSGFREELRALLVLAGPAVSKVASVGGRPGGSGARYACRPG